MKLNKKVYYSAFGVVICIIGIVCITFYFNYEEVFNLNVSGEDFSKNDIKLQDEKTIKIESIKRVQDIEFSNIQINLLAQNKCEFIADIKNTSDKYLKSKNIKISIIDASGKVDEIFGGITTELAGFEPSKFKSIVLSDITDAIDVKIEISSGEETKDE